MSIIYIYKWTLDVSLLHPQFVPLSQCWYAAWKLGFKGLKSVKETVFSGAQTMCMCTQVFTGCMCSYAFLHTPTNSSTVMWQRHGPAESRSQLHFPTFPAWENSLIRDHVTSLYSNTAFGWLRRTGGICFFSFRLLELWLNKICNLLL